MASVVEASVADAGGLDQRLPAVVLAVVVERSATEVGEDPVAVDPPVACFLLGLQLPSAMGAQELGEFAGQADGAM